jgi:hypothetical protein
MERFKPGPDFFKGVRFRGAKNFVKHKKRVHPFRVHPFFGGNFSGAHIEALIFR